MRRVNSAAARFFTTGEDQILDEVDRSRRTPHTCHAQGCTESVEPQLLMCRRHWYMVPKPLRQAVWSTYRKGQHIDKRTAAEYLAAAKAAIAAVAEAERPSADIFR